MDFTATQISREIKFWQIQTVQKCHFLNFDLSKFEQLWSPKFTKIQSSQSHLNLPKFNFT